jgi:hypothetical protein
MTGMAITWPVDGRIYVLADDGPPEHWRYEFIATATDRRSRMLAVRVIPVISGQLRLRLFCAPGSWRGRAHRGHSALAQASGLTALIGASMPS